LSGVAAAKRLLRCFIEGGRLGADVVKSPSELRTVFLAKLAELLNRGTIIVSSVIMPPNLVYSVGNHLIDQPTLVQGHAGLQVRKEGHFAHESRDEFSELLLILKPLTIPFQAEYEGSIPFTRSKVLKLEREPKRFRRRSCG
jgi:hypothetical protein